MLLTCNKVACTYYYLIFMRISKLLVPVALILALIMVSCTEKSKFESAAKKQMEKTLKELAKDPSTVRLSNVQIVFSNDSLCIIHADFSAKNALGMELTDRGEYIYISSSGKLYESYDEISDDNGGVFVNEEEYNSKKKGNIYEDLSYESGLRYLAAVHVNGNGREVGKEKRENFTIPVPTGTGLWELNRYKDEFGEEGYGKYLTLIGHGTFSNSATTDSDLTAVLFVYKYGFSIRLVEYNSIIVKSDNIYSCRIKDSLGDVYDMMLHNDSESGQMTISYADNAEKMSKILERGGTIIFSMREYDAYSTPDTYLFKLDVTGYDKAKALL